MSVPTTIAKITVRIADGVAAVQMDNPAKRNAMTKDMCIELAQLMPRLDADPSVTVVTLRGAGSTFSAGAAIYELSSVLLDPQDDGSLIDHLSRADDAITSLSKPTVALVNGACIGGGWQIASACDFIVASERSIFAVTPAKLGIVYPRPGIERLVRQVGPADAKFILFTGASFTARRARELGLVTETVADDVFEERCRSLLEVLVNRSRFSMHALKRLVDLTATDDPDLDSEWEATWAAMIASPDMEIGTSAFLGRREPRFTWSPTAP